MAYVVRIKPGPPFGLMYFTGSGLDEMRSRAMRYASGQEAQKAAEDHGYTPEQITVLEVDE